MRVTPECPLDTLDTLGADVSSMNMEVMAFCKLKRHVVASSSLSTLKKYTSSLVRMLNVTSEVKCFTLLANRIAWAWSSEMDLSLRAVGLSDEYTLILHWLSLTQRLCQFG